MTIDPIEILRQNINEPNLGLVAREALAFLDGSDLHFQQSPGTGQSTQSVVRMYEIRKSLKKFKKDAFIGLDESIRSLSKREVIVHLSVIETVNGVVSVWLADDTFIPLGIVVAKF